MKKLLMCIAALMLSVSSQATPSYNTQSRIAPTTAQTTATPTRVQINDSLSSNERRIREATVKVVTPHGHGTGGLIKYRDVHLVLTANHVADGDLGETYLLATETETEWGILIYKDPLNDISLLYVPNEFRYAEPIRWRPRTELIEGGQTINYAGYPSWHSVMSFRGHVAGFEVHPDAGQQIILQTYGWFGCSGAVIYDTNGRAIGILWAVDVERSPTFQVQENMIWVSPIQNLDMNLALSALCYRMPNPPRACR